MLLGACDLKSLSDGSSGGLRSYDSKSELLGFGNVTCGDSGSKSYCNVVTVLSGKSDGKGCAVNGYVCVLGNSPGNKNFAVVGTNNGESYGSSLSVVGLNVKSELLATIRETGNLSDESEAELKAAILAVKEKF